MLSKLKLLPIIILRKLRNIYRAAYIKYKESILNAKIDAGAGRFIISSPEIEVRISKGEHAQFIVDGDIIIRSDLGGNRPIRITIGKSGRLEIKNEFVIGDGVLIIIAGDAELIIGGRKNESGSGITCDSKIMVTKRVEIGYDLICAWHVLITDSDHHQIKGQKASMPVSIGDHVWIASGATILKGSQIGDGCIIASQALVHRQSFEEKSLIAGIPANIVKKSVEWSRDMVSN